MSDKPTIAESKMGSLGATFINLKVKTKVLSGFVIVLFLLIGVAAVAYTGFNRVSHQFQHYATAVGLAIDASEIELDLVKLRRDIDNYVGTRNIHAAESALKMEEELRARIGQGMTLAATEAEKKELEAMAQALSVVVANFKKVEALESERDKLATDLLDVAGPKLESDFNDVIRRATKSGDTNTAVLASAGLYAVMKARLNANLILARHESASVEEAEKAFAAAKKAVGQVEKVAVNRVLRSEAGEIKGLIASYVEAFQRSESIDKAVETLVNEKIREESTRIMDEAEKVKAGAAAEEKKDAEETHAVVNASEKYTFVLAICAIVLGLVMAWIIGNGIASPVIGMTSAMGRLADGDKTITVPALGRKDEIGQMADAVEVFKQNAIEMERLAAEQKAEQDRQIERGKKLEAAVADFDKVITDVVNVVSSAASEMQATAQSLSATAEETTQQANAVAAASEQTTQNVQTVASAAEELSSSIGEIGQQVNKSTTIVANAVTQIEDTNSKVSNLSDAANKIGDVVTLITEIAEKTNLLALNATIEAARAGEAGKGFAVVASEVKTLASQTAKATEEIADQVNAIQETTQSSANSIQLITQTINGVNEISTTIASAVQEQGAATEEISRNVQQAAAGTAEVTSNISGVTEASQQTSDGSTEVLNTASELAKNGERLKLEVENFLKTVGSL